MFRVTMPTKLLDAIQDKGYFRITHLPVLSEQGKISVHDLLTKLCYF